MKMVNIADLKRELSAYVERVVGGEEIVISKRNVPVARMVALSSTGSPGRPRSGPGLFRGTVAIHGDLVAPALDSEEWGGLS